MFLIVFLAGFTVLWQLLWRIIWTKLFQFLGLFAHLQYGFQSWFFCLCFCHFLWDKFCFMAFLSCYVVVEILWLYFFFSSIGFGFRIQLEIYDDCFKSGFFVVFFPSWIVNCLAISLGINFVQIIPWSNLFQSLKVWVYAMYGDNF